MKRLTLLTVLLAALLTVGRNVLPDQLVRLPEAFSLEQAMAIGTAGYTSMLCVHALQDHGLQPGDGDNHNQTEQRQIRACDGKPHDPRDPPARTGQRRRLVAPAPRRRRSTLRPLRRRPGHARNAVHG